MPKYKYDWARVDWRLSNTEIAAQLNCPYNTVAKRRHKLKVGAADKMATRSDKGIRKVTYLPSKAQQIAATQAAQLSPKSGKFSTNCHAKKWRITSPDGQVFVISNLYHFIREHTHLFKPDDVIFKKSSGGGEYCNATAGLLNITSGKTAAWKGWQAEKLED